jgi:hypothetical protein
MRVLLSAGLTSFGEERGVARKALEDAGCDLTESGDVADCDVLVLVVAKNLTLLIAEGYLSDTESTYLRAREIGKPCLAYLEAIPTGTFGSVQAFRERLSRDAGLDVRVVEFTSTRQLRTAIEVDITVLQAEQRFRSARSSSPSHDLRIPFGSPSTGVFVCYRRDDSQDAAGRLYDRLVKEYGPDRVFMDIDSAPLGVDFVDHVAEHISRCGAVIVVIGKRWLTIKDKQRRRRLNDVDDLVRAEIRAALQQGIPVIPVMVQNASMPDAKDLPDDLRLLVRRTGIQLRAEHWKDGVDRLVRELKTAMGQS